MKDYSNGVGDKAVDATHNISITDVKKIFNRIQNIESTNLLLSASKRKIEENVDIFAEDKNASVCFGDYINYALDNGKIRTFDMISNPPKASIVSETTFKNSANPLFKSMKNSSFKS